MQAYSIIKVSENVVISLIKKWYVYQLAFMLLSVNKLILTDKIDSENKYKSKCKMSIHLTTVQIGIAYE